MIIRSRLRLEMIRVVREAILKYLASIRAGQSLIQAGT